MNKNDLTKVSFILKPPLKGWETLGLYEKKTRIEQIELIELIFYG